MLIHCFCLNHSLIKLKGGFESLSLASILSCWPQPHLYPMTLSSTWGEMLGPMVWFLSCIPIVPSERSSQDSTLPKRKRFFFLFQVNPSVFPFPPHWVRPRFNISFLSIFTLPLPKTLSFLPLNLVNFLSHCPFLLSSATFLTTKIFFSPSFICGTPGLWEPILLLPQGTRLLLNKSGVWGSSLKGLLCYSNSFSDVVL